MRRWISTVGLAIVLLFLLGLVWWARSSAGSSGYTYSARETWVAPTHGEYPFWSADGKSLVLSRECDRRMRPSGTPEGSAVIVAQPGSQHFTEVTTPVIAGLAMLRAFPNENASAVYAQSPLSGPSDKTDEWVGLWLWKLSASSGDARPERICALPRTIDLDIAWKPNLLLTINGGFAKSAGKGIPDGVFKCAIYQLNGFAPAKTIRVDRAWVSSPSLAPDGRSIWYIGLDRTGLPNGQVRYGLTNLSVRTGKARRYGPLWDRPRSNPTECPAQPGLIAMIADHGPDPKDRKLVLFDTRNPEAGEQMLIDQGAVPLAGLAWHPGKMELAYVAAAGGRVHVVHVDRTPAKRK